jgi:hypothetical protein
MFGKKKAGYSAETLAYQSRVETAGGAVVDLGAVNDAYALIAARSLSPAAVWMGDGGWDWEVRTHTDTWDSEGA